jgi:hypothetical protein
MQNTANKNYSLLKAVENCRKMTAVLLHVQATGGKINAINALVQ